MKLEQLTLVCYKSSCYAMLLSKDERYVAEKLNGKFKLVEASLEKIFQTVMCFEITQLKKYLLKI